MYKSVIHSLIVLSLSRRQNTLSVQYSLKYSLKGECVKTNCKQRFLPLKQVSL